MSASQITVSRCMCIQRTNDEWQQHGGAHFPLSPSENFLQLVLERELMYLQRSNNNKA